jgi:anti-sigma factor RsiW
VSHPDEFLSAYLDGELAVSERGEVVAHLGACPSCRDELEALAAVRGSVRGLPVLDLPPGVVPAPARPDRRRVPALAWAASAAAVAALVIGVLAAGDGPEPAFDLSTLVDRHTARVVVDPGISTVRGPVGSP